VLNGAVVDLRAVEREDLGQLLEWRNQPALRRCFREYRELSMEEQLRWHESLAGDRSTAMFSIVERSSGRLLGAAGLCYIDWVDRTCDLSIYVGADGLYLDDDYAPDAAAVLLDHAFGTLDLHRVWVEIYAFDEAKASFLEALGFQLEGRHREHHYDGHQRHDSLFYGLLRHEHGGGVEQP
jgi:hypothetical protein